MKKRTILLLIVVVVTVSLLAGGFLFYGSSKTTDSNIIANQPSGYKIALLTDPVYGRNQFLLQAYDQLMAMEIDYGFQTAWVEISESQSWVLEAESLSAQDYDMIIGLSWEAGSAFASIADNYPNTKFVTIDSATEKSNVKSITYEVTNGCYVLGAMIATAFPDENCFGYIGNFDNDSNYEYQYGFLQGLLSVNPDAIIMTEFVESYVDIQAVNDAGRRLVDSGITVIIGSVSSQANEGLFQLAIELEEFGTQIYVTGVSVDQTTPQNTHIIGGVTKDTGTAVKYAVNSLLDNSFTYDDLILGVAQDGFGVVHVTGAVALYRDDTLMTDEVLLVGRRLVESMVAGTLSCTVENTTEGSDAS